MRGPVSKYSHSAMACVFELIFPGRRSPRLRRAARAAFAELDRLESKLSRFIPTSDIAKLNALEEGESTRLGPDAHACLKLAEKYRRQTQGAFDVSAAGGVRADLGGIGKGFALDRMAAVLAERGAGPVLLQAAQSTALAATGGRAPVAWRVGLRKPGSPSKAVAWIGLARGALSGSGTVLQGPHIFSPFTGKAGAVRAAAWAVAPTAAQADAFSTAFMLLPASAVKKICARNRGIAGILAGPGGLKVFGRPPGAEFEFRGGKPGGRVT